MRRTIADTLRRDFGTIASADLDRTAALLPLTLFVVVLCHRGICWFLYGAHAVAVVQANPGWLTWQFLPIQAYLDHFWSSLFYLQQTPPLPHVLFGALLKVLTWPVGVAEALFGVQALISAGTTALLFALLRRGLGAGALRRVVAIVVALWFGLSNDVFLLEVASFGQLFYESTAMLITTAIALCLCGDSQGRPPSPRGTMLAGVLTGLGQLTRASLSYLAVPVVLAVAFRFGRSRLAMVLLPVLLLQGAWSVKGYMAYGRVSAAASSWAGMNMTHGINVFNGQSLPDGDGPVPFTRAILADADRYPAWLIAAIRAHGFVGWESDVVQTYVPAEVRQVDMAAQRAMGGSDPFTNTLALALVSDQYARADLRYIAAHPGDFVRKAWLGYQTFWQPIADFSGFYMSPLFVEPTLRHFLGHSRLLFRRTVFERAEVGAGQPRVVHPPTVSLDPLDYIAFYVVSIVVPLMVLLDGFAAARGRPRWIGADLWMLIALSTYGIAVSSLVDLSENMRFRLTFEPVLLCTSVLTLFILGQRALPLRPWLRVRTGRHEMPSPATARPGSDALGTAGSPSLR